MTFIETHTHLYSEEFDADREAVVERALAIGIDKFFLPAIDSAYTKRMYAFEKAYPKHTYLMTGLHPVSVAEKDYKKELAWVEKALNERKFYAIGEIGIDLHWHPESLAEQQDAFRTQIRWAKERALPIVIHCRDAFDEVFEILEAEKGADLWGIFHCFTGNLAQAKQAVSLGMKLGIGGVVTFKNGKIDRFLQEIPLQEIVLETDSPYLAPTPYRGKRNESSYLLQVAEKLASVYAVGLDEIAQQTTHNAEVVFKLK